MIKGVPKILGLENISHICTSWSKCMTCIASDPVFDLTIYVVQVCLSFHTYLKLHSKPFRDRMKRRQNNQMPWWGSYTLSDRVNHLRNLHFILQNS
jgi:hypothetical protein